MKIGPTEPLSSPVGPTTAANNAAATPPTPVKPVAPARGAGEASTGAAETSQVALSATAEALRRQGASEVFDAEKVDRISSAIAEGRYQVNPGVIADKLIANARELIDRSRP